MFARGTPPGEAPAVLPEGDWPAVLEAALTGDVSGAPGPAWVRLPFAHVLSGFLRHARAVSRAPTSELTSSAWTTMETQLLERLCDVSALVLGRRFRSFVADADPLAIHMPVPSHDGELPPRSRYERFVTSMRAGGLVDELRTHPVLGRLLATITMQWIETGREFLDRLRLDRVAVCAMFSPDEDPGPVVRITPGRSDPHHGGRTVFDVTWRSGLRLIYKPKCVGMERAFSAFSGWCAERGAPFALPGLAVLDRRSHGWIEYVEHGAQTDVEGARRYYERAGALLAYVYTLGGADAHCQNVIARGDTPVLVDAETLLRAEPAGFGPGDGDTVLDTGLLPQWHRGPGETLYDVSGFGAPAVQATGYPSSRWIQVNTDRMRRIRETARLRAPTNRPLIDGCPPTVQAHAGALVRGFRATYRFLAAERAAIGGTEGPLELFASQQVRVVLQPTDVYALLERRLLQAVFLRDAGRRASQIARLGTIPPDAWSGVSASSLAAVRAAEARALERMDIPCFMVAAGGRDLLADGAVVAPAFFRRSAMDRAARRLAALSPADLRRQVALIEGALTQRPKA